MFLIAALTTTTAAAAFVCEMWKWICHIFVVCRSIWYWLRCLCNILFTHSHHKTRDPGPVCVVGRKKKKKKNVENLLPNHRYVYLLLLRVYILHFSLVLRRRSIAWLCLLSMMPHERIRSHRLFVYFSLRFLVFLFSTSPYYFRPEFHLLCVAVYSVRVCVWRVHKIWAISTPCQC